MPKRISSSFGTSTTTSKMADQDLLCGFDTASDIDKLMESPLLNPVASPDTLDDEVSHMRQALYNWKEIAVYTKSVLCWSEPWYPSAIFGTTTVVFFLLWLIEPNLLTIITVVALIVTVMDALLNLRMITACLKSLGRGWDVQCERDFDDLCTDLVVWKVLAQNKYRTYSHMKYTNRKMYFALTITGLMLLLWIVRSLNLAFVTYILVTAVLLWPGIKSNGIWKKCMISMTGAITDFLGKIKEKRS